MVTKVQTQNSICMHTVVKLSKPLKHQDYIAALHKLGSLY